MLEILNLIRLILYLRHVDWQVVVDWRFEVCSSVMLTNSLQKFQKSVSVIWLHINKLAVICIFGWQLSANAPQTVDNKWSTSMCYTANKCNSYLNTLNVGGSYLHFWLTVLHHRQLTTNDQLIRGTQPKGKELVLLSHLVFDFGDNMSFNATQEFSGPQCSGWKPTPRHHFIINVRN